MLSITMSESHKRRGHVKHDRNNRKTTEMCDRPLYEVHLFRPVLRFVLNKTLVDKKKKTLIVFIHGLKPKGACLSI